MIWFERLRSLRIENKKTLDNVAQFLGISMSTVCKFENGSRSPKAEQIVALCKMYGVSADYLLGLTDKR